MKRPTEKDRKKKAGVDCRDKQFLEQFPHLAEFMSDGFWDDGKARELPTLGVSIDGAGCRLSLNDHALHQSAYTDSESLMQALSLLDNAIKEGTLGWRVWKAGKGK